MMMHSLCRRARAVCWLALIVLSGAALAQEGPPRPSDPIGGKLYPPELIMGHQAELGIDQAQREAILKELERAQAQFPRLQWQLQAATEQLASMLEAPKVDETKALAQAAEVMKLETEIKRMHLGLLIRIRNLLTDPQRAKLQQLRRTAP